MALTKVDQVVREICREVGDFDYRHYDIILGHAIRGFSELQLYAIPSVRIKYYKCNDLKVIKWPNDCIKPLVVGLQRDGKVCNLSIDRSLQPEVSECCSISEAEADITNELAHGTNILGFGEYSAVGKGYDKIGLVQHDKDRRQSVIVCRVKKKDKFVFVYISDGISDGLDEVPNECIPTIREYIYYEYYRIKAPTISDRARLTYEKEFTKLRRFYKDNTIEEWIEAIIK